MSEALQDYESGVELFYNGRLLGEISKFTVNDDAQGTEVNTTTGGLTGFAFGPLKAEFSWDSFMPKSGMEVDYYQAIKLKRSVTLRVRAAGATESYTVKLMTRDRSFDVSSAATVSVKAIGKRLGATT